MERDVTYIREELEEVILNQLRRWEGVIEQEEATTLSSSGVQELPGLLWHLSSAREALVLAEGILVGDVEFSAAEVMVGFGAERDMEDDRDLDDDRYADRAVDDRILQDGIEEEILARFTSSGEIEVEERSNERSYERSADCYRD